MLRRSILGALAVATLLPSAAVAQTATTPNASPARVAITTTLGRIVVEVETGKAPVTAANFLRYVDSRRLDGMQFYRTVKVADHFGFVQFGVQNDPKRIYPAIRHEPTTRTGLRHLDGTLSIGRFAPGTARGEFTISVGDQPSFDADPARPGDNLGYAAFGRVVEGMDVVMRIFDAPVAPDKAIQGSFKGQVPVAPVRIVSVRRLPPAPPAAPAP